MWASNVGVFHFIFILYFCLYFYLSLYFYISRSFFLMYFVHQKQSFLFNRLYGNGSANAIASPLFTNVNIHYSINTCKSTNLRLCIFLKNYSTKSSVNVSEVYKPEKSYANVDLDKDGAHCLLNRQWAPKAVFIAEQISIMEKAIPFAPFAPFSPPLKGW